MKKLAVLIITSVLASNTFAFPFYKKYQKPHTLVPQKHTALNDFTGVWLGSCNGGSGDEDEDGNWEARLTITQNKEQMSLMFGDKKEDTVVLNLNPLSSQSNSSYNKREAAIQRVSIPSGDMISINYESIAEEGTGETGSHLLLTSLHVDIIKKGDSLELRSSHFPASICILKKAG